MHTDQQTTHPLSSPLLNGLSQGVILLDHQSRILFLNKAAEDILGIKDSKMYTLPDTLFGFSLAEAVLQKKRHLVSYKSPGKGELTLEIQLIPIESGLYLLLQDRTKLEELHQTANRATRLKELGGMAAMLAHEIRNPLGGIKGFASLLHKDLKNRPDLQQMAGFILDGTEHLNRLVSHILNFAHPFQTRIEPQDLVPFIQDLYAHILADQTLNRNLHLKFNTLFDSFIIPMDSQLLRSALLNLIINGIQAMPDGGTLTISLDNCENNAVIQISDTGTGIPTENLSKLFSKFFTTKPDGNGFGLLEVNQVVQAHGGKIEIETTLGRGSSFTIYLPVDHAY